MYANFGNVCGNRDVREKRSWTTRLIPEDDETFDKTLEAQGNVDRGEQKHEDGRHHDFSV